MSGVGTLQDAGPPLEVSVVIPTSNWPEFLRPALGFRMIHLTEAHAEGARPRQRGFPDLARHVGETADRRVVNDSSRELLSIRGDRVLVRVCRGLGLGAGGR